MILGSPINSINNASNTIRWEQLANLLMFLRFKKHWADLATASISTRDEFSGHDRVSRPPNEKALRAKSRWRTDQGRCLQPVASPGGGLRAAVKRGLASPRSFFAGSFVILSRSASNAPGRTTVPTQLQLGRNPLCVCVERDRDKCVFSPARTNQSDMHFSHAEDVSRFRLVAWADKDVTSKSDSEKLPSGVLNKIFSNSSW